MYDFRRIEMCTGKFWDGNHEKCTGKWKNFRLRRYFLEEICIFHQFDWKIRAEGAIFLFFCFWDGNFEPDLGASWKFFVKIWAGNFSVAGEKITDSVLPCYFRRRVSLATHQTLRNQLMTKRSSRREYRNPSGHVRKSISNWWFAGKSHGSQFTYGTRYGYRGDYR